MRSIAFALAATVACAAPASAHIRYKATAPAQPTFWWEVQPTKPVVVHHRYWHRHYAKKAAPRPHHVAIARPKPKNRPAPAQARVPVAPPPNHVDQALVESKALGALLGVPEGWADGLTTMAGKIGTAIVNTSRQVRCQMAGGRTLVDCKTGAVAYVAEDFKASAQCVLAKLDAAGYPVQDIGGFGERGNPSAHPTGHALDVNQCGRDCTSPRMSRTLAHEIAGECRVTSGGDWRNGDLGHFEAMNSFGYTGGWHRHRTQYASARHRGGNVRYAHHRVYRRRYAKA